MTSVVESLPLPNVSSTPPPTTESPCSPPTGTSTPTPATTVAPPSDSITCGQCSQKFYHVTQFLQHKSSCPGIENTETKDNDEINESSTPIENAYLCAECPSTVYPSSDLLRLHLLDSHGVYLPAGTDMGPMLQETKAYQVHPDQARKMANRAKPNFTTEQAASDCSSNSEQADKEGVDSGNDSDIKKDFSAGNLSNSPNGSAGNSSGNCVDSGNSEMRSPVTQSVQPSPLKPDNVQQSLPQLPSTMARSLLESMVANRLRANLEQKNATSATTSASSPPSQEPAKLPVASALNHLFQNPVYQHSLMPFNGLQTNPLQAQFIQAQQAALQQASQVRAAQAAAAQAAQQAAQQQAQVAQAQAQNGSDGNLYQPAVKRRRRGYGSEVGTENLKILRDGEGYCCPLCNYKSRVRSNLTIHLRTHTGYKPYKCPYCPYSSSQSGPLKIHIRGHTGEKPYRCDYCSYASTCRGNLKVHQERHHKEEIAKHGLNAGIKGPNDQDDVLAIEEEKVPISSSSTPTPSTPPVSTSNLASFASNLRVPPFTQLPGIPGMGGHMPFGFGQMNPNLLAGLLKPKTQETPGQTPHFPLNMTGQQSSPIEAQVTEVKEEKMD